MGTLYRSPSTNFWSSTLNGAINSSVQTITLNSTTGLRAPGVMIIDRQDASGNNTPSSREVISYTGISGSDLTGVTRAFSSSTARSHSDGALIEAVMETAMWDNLISAATVVMTSDGVLNSVLSPISIARMQVTQSALSSLASTTEEWTTRAYISTLTITTLINASGASIVGGFGTTADPLTQKNIAVTSIASVAQLNVGNYLNASGASISGVLASKVVTSTRDMTAASGSVAYTGAGFRPKGVVAWGCIAGNASFSVGFGDDGKVSGRLERDADGNFYIGTELLYILQTTGARQDATITSYDADGITLAWTKTGSPTGTADLKFLFIRG